MVKFIEKVNEDKRDLAFVKFIDYKNYTTHTVQSELESPISREKVQL